MGSKCVVRLILIENIRTPAALPTKQKWEIGGDDMDTLTLRICPNCGSDVFSSKDIQKCHNCMTTMTDTGITRQEWEEKSVSEQKEIIHKYYHKSEFVRNHPIITIATVLIIIIVAICLIFNISLKNYYREIGYTTGSSYNDTNESEHTCAICGKPATAQLTFDHEWYCNEHYADAWNWYNDKSQGKNVY